jgi:hypothetical protein
MDELNQTLANFIQQFQQAQQDQQQVLQQILAAQQQPPVPQVPPPAQNQPIFAMSPAQVNADQFIDYSTPTGAKLFQKATEPLPNKFDVEATNVNVFNEQLLTRAKIASWDTGDGDILTIPDANQVNHNLISEYGSLTFAEIEAYVRSYVTATQPGQPAPQNRRRQNDYQLFVCISTSLTDSGIIKLLAERNRYTIGTHESGSLFFKLLMQKAIVDTRATASHFRTNLKNLDAYMSTVNSDIRQFNQYVKVNLEGLRARGEENNDIMVNLFDGYLMAGDRHFVDYIQVKKDQYEEGADIDADKLLQLALNKYENLVTEGRWKALTPEQEQLMALSATVDHLKDENLRLSQSLIHKQKSKQQEEGKNNNHKHSQSQKNRQRQKQDEAWKKKPPKDDEPTTKEVYNKTWHWCPDHLAWTKHTPAECTLAEERNKDHASSNIHSTTRSNNNHQRRSALNQAVSAMLEELAEED